MSLRLRLVLLTLFLVTAATVTLSALQLRDLVNNLSDDTIARARIVGDQVSNLVADRISLHLPEYAAPADLQETRVLWGHIVISDPEIPDLIKRTMAKDYFISVLQVNVLDASGATLAAFPTEVIGTVKRESFVEWKQRPWYKRAYDLVTAHPDWEVQTNPIGVGEDPIIRVQVLTSSILLRNEPIDLLKRLALISSVVILVSLALALLATHSALRPIHRIERTIDRIAQGNFQAGEKESSLAKEFQVVESKLNLLGQRMQMLPLPGAGEKKLDVLMERVATQFDLAQRLSAISRLSGGVAHEIKNPLNAISLRLELLKVRLGDSDEEVTGEIEVLSKEVLRLNRVVTTFLDFSRPVEVNFEEVDLAALTREVSELIRPQAAVSKIEVECTTPNEPASMSGDADLLKQAILNLVTNAVEAMGASGGHLRIEVSQSQHNNNWVLTVNDSGPGIPRELRDKVFQLYFTSKARGSGIGLAMTYRATQLHNGTIDFDSESGVGTTFRLEFPAIVTHA